MNQYGKVAVLMGGDSSERAISLASGQAVSAALKRNNVDAHPIDVGADTLLRLERERFDRAFIVLHGGGGEGGLIQGGLEQIQIPYTGSRVLGSVLAMDKCRSKMIWRYHQLPTPCHEELNPASDWGYIIDRLDTPLMVKPVCGGSSIGGSKVIDKKGLQQAWQKAAHFDSRVMAERWVSGSEYTVSILGDRVLPPIKLETNRAFYDYIAKYEDPNTRYICPCGLPEQKIEQIHQIAIKACQSLDVCGWARIDLMLDAVDRPWLIEVNTVPGLTSHSLVPMAAKEVGISFDQLVLKILDTSFKQHFDQKEVANSDTRTS